MQFILHKISTAKFVQNISFRLDWRGVQLKEDKIGYFGIEKRYALDLFARIRENQHSCIVKNIKISGIWREPWALEAVVDDKQVILELEKTCLSFTHILSLSLQSIKLSNLSGFMATFLNLNN